ncbi:hypothetical protein Hanom_Chr00s001124g01674361 [Helianthus anomalus]
MVRILRFGLQPRFGSFGKLGSDVRYVRIRFKFGFGQYEPTALFRFVSGHIRFSLAHFGPVSVHTVHIGQPQSRHSQTSQLGSTSQPRFDYGSTRFGYGSRLG